MYLKHYLKELDYENIPEFLIKYLNAPSLQRLKKVGYFCGMDYASKDIYDFSEYISRYDHSLTTALLTYKLTNNKIWTIAALFHDVSTPCFSHVIDYMNKDYEKQESTEKYTSIILRNDKYLEYCLKIDNIDILDIINFKQYSIVDNNRPKVCADRIDGIILTGMGWLKIVSDLDITEIINDLIIYNNEYNEKEIGFKKEKVANKVIDINKNIDNFCHSKEDNYMMHLLAKITKLAIDKNYISYEQLFLYDEENLFNIFKLISDMDINELLWEFKNIKENDIPEISLPNIKVRKIKPIVNGKRIT